jgi:hypothetical protein
MVDPGSVSRTLSTDDLNRGDNRITDGECLDDNVHLVGFARAGITSTFDSVTMVPALEVAVEA